MKSGRERLSRVLGMLCLGAAAVFPEASAAVQTPPPVFTGIGVAAVATVDATASCTYQYNLSNPTTNTLTVQFVQLDISGAPDLAPGAAAGPPGWRISVLEVDRAMMWASTGRQVPFGPGTTLEGLQLVAAVPPAVRALTIEPDVFPYLEALAAERESMGKVLEAYEQLTIQRAYVYRGKTLGPLGVAPGSFEHWDTLLADVAQAKQLGWLADPALAATVGTNLAAARQAVVAGDPSAAKANLQTVIDAMQQSTPAQRTSEGYGLVSLNAKFLYDYLVATAPWPWEPKLTLAPERARHSLGETHAATAALFNVATKAPIGGWIDISIASGPHQGLGTSWYSDAQGQLSLAYRGLRLGEDDIVACTRIESGPPCVHASVKWEGGPDLVVTLWVPPLLISAPGQEFVVSEETRNLGTLPASASVTRYYISTSPQIDPATAITFGERPVPPLAVSERSRVDRQPFTIPASLPPGTYSLAACADADNLIAELDEDNNCSYSTVFPSLSCR
jgi:hypothetical protein